VPPETWVVVGASRGLGAEFVAQLAADGRDVAGLSRADGFDVRDEDAFSFDRPIDVLVVAAGVQNRVAGVEELDLQAVSDTFDVNTLGPLRVVRRLLPRLRAGNRRVIVFLSSRMGSFGEYDGPSMYAYRASKAALNMFVRCIADELEPDGFTCVAVHPGWVRTDMGGASAPLTAAESVAAMRALIDGLGPPDNGRFLDLHGRPLPW